MLKNNWQHATVCVQEAGGEEHEAPAQDEDVPDDTQDEYWTAVNQTDTWTYMHSVRKLLLGSFPQTQALFNCIMTIMNMSYNSSLIGECCSCEARDDNHCTSNPFGFYFKLSQLAFPPAVFHLTAPMKENLPFLFFKLLMF